MDLMGILTILGVVISLIFGFLGIYFSVRKRQYPGEITFVKESLVSLFDELVENIENLQVLYKSHPIQRNIVLLKGHLLNTGAIDITQDKVKKQLTASLPDEYKWLEAKIITSSPGLETHINISQENELCFDLGLFRRDETISFQALAQIPSSESKKNVRELFNKILNWHHRIADTKNQIQQTSYNPNRYTKSSLLIAVFTSLIMISTPFIFLLPTFRDIRVNVGYEITKDDKTILVRLNPKIDGASEIIGVNDEYRESIDFEKFFSTYSPKPVLYTDQTGYLPMVALSGLYSLLGVMFLIYRYSQYRNNKNLEKLLNKSREIQNSA